MLEISSPSESPSFLHAGCAYITPVVLRDIVSAGDEEFS